MKDCELTACKIVFKIKDIYFRKIKIVKKKKKKSVMFPTAKEKSIQLNGVPRSMTFQTTKIKFTSIT